MVELATAAAASTINRRAGLAVLLVAVLQADSVVHPVGRLAEEGMVHLVDSAVGIAETSNARALVVGSMTGMQNDHGTKPLVPCGRFPIRTRSPMSKVSRIFQVEGISRFIHPWSLFRLPFPFHFMQR